ncbi:MAG: hypothetical protein NTV97_18520 [Alphaproteobacteria bacterium]|nr:hypothetical protein [Alphaproteobacteria bacterium]
MGTARRGAHQAMSNPRGEILDGIRRSLKRGELTGAQREVVEQRLAAPPRGPAVARAQLAQDEKIGLFCQWALTNNATVARVSASDVPGEVAAYLARNNLPAEAVLAPLPASKTTSVSPRWAKVMLKLMVIASPGRKLSAITASPRPGRSSRRRAPTIR